jgi:hypothetical protein
MFKYASGNFYTAISEVVVVVGTKRFFIAVLCVCLAVCHIGFLVAKCQMVLLHCKKKYSS